MNRKHSFAARNNSPEHEIHSDTQESSSAQTARRMAPDKPLHTQANQRQNLFAESTIQKSAGPCMVSVFFRDRQASTDTTLLECRLCSVWKCIGICAATPRQNDS